MEYYTDLIYIKPKKKVALTIGKFDGLHRGHELLCEKLREKKAEGFDTAVLTFDRSIRDTLYKDEEKNIISKDERKALFRKEKVDYLIELPFSEKLMKTSPEDFIRLLYKELNMRYFVAGSDFHFGYKGKGDAALLKDLSGMMGFELDILEKLKKDERDISSTYIREEIKKGNVSLADELLGYSYFIWGEIVHGNHIGRTIGIPTINMIPPKDKLLPPNGVYVTKIEIDTREYHGITNIGVKPTVDCTGNLTVETHIFDFKEDVYEKYAKVSFLKFLRPETKYKNITELKAQIMVDEREALSYFNHI